MKSRRESRSVWIRSNYVDFSDKISLIKFILHVVSLIVCLFCLIYETTTLLSLYFGGKTIAENRVERLVKSRLPAVTLCLPTFLDMEKFAELFLNSSEDPYHKTIYDKHQAIKMFVVKNGWNDEAQVMQRQLFEEFLWNVYVKSNISLYDIMNKFLADWQIEYKVYHGKTKYNKAFDEKDVVVELPLPKLVVSLVPFIDARECYTIFSDFDDHFKDYKLIPIEIEIRFRHNVSSFPFIRLYEGDIYVSLHSPNSLPDFKRENVFHELKMGMVNFITYSETQTKLLPEPYETKCKTYELETRAECVHICMNERLCEVFHLDCVWTLHNNKLIRKDALGDLANKSLCNHHSEPRKWDIVKELFNLERSCESQCPRNCFESSYQYEIQTRKGREFADEHNCFSINIDHNNLPDQVIEHKPIMDWITLVSNWGGLLGMWLGFSVLYTCTKFINRVFEKYLLKKKKKFFVPLTLPLHANKW